MCGRFEQSKTRKYYAEAIGADTSDRQKWAEGDPIAHYNVAPGLCPYMFRLQDGELQTERQRWGYGTPEEAETKRKTYVR